MTAKECFTDARFFIGLTLGVAVGLIIAAIIDKIIQ